MKLALDCPVVNFGNGCDEPSGSALLLCAILGRLKARHSLGWTTHVQI
jgi:hypothetical protein